MDYLIDQAAQLIANSKRIIIFTGAGISTESGIPDFRSPGGIWSRYDPDEFTLQKYLVSEKSRKLHWQFYKDGKLFGSGAQPNPAHIAAAELFRMGKLDCVITQNVDSLHQGAGVPEERVIELHGNLRWAYCLDCNKRYPMNIIMTQVSQGAEDPHCDSCKGILKPETIFFGEALPQRALSEAAYRSRKADLFIVIGSSLVVTPAAFMPQYAVDGGAKLIIINLTPTPMDGYAAVVIHDKAGEVMSKVLEKVKRFSQL